MSNNKKARELVASTEEMMHEIENQICDTDLIFEDDLKGYNALREEVSSHTLKTFDDVYIEITNIEFKGAVVTYTDDAMENIGEEFCNCKDEIKPVYIPKVQSGAFGTTIASLLIGAATATVAAVAVGVTQLGIQIDLKKVPTEAEIAPILEWFGGLLPFGNSNVLDRIEGAALLGGVAGTVTLIAALIFYNSKSKKNLIAAEATFEEATTVHLEKSTQNRKTMNMTEYIEALERNLQTLQIYLDEYNAILKRIIHVEGTDYNAYAIQSQSDVQKALSIYKRTKSLITTKVVTPEGSASSASRYEVDKSIKFLEELTGKEYKKEVEKIEKIDTIENKEEDTEEIEVIENTEDKEQK
ncbi:MAG: hypothetical protein DRG24_04260 [Epsilonproteobacteria bacterium]|nr:MAG: hypothetical protein DRG24_04260 [Campylobacterota bacterium]